MADLDIQMGGGGGGRFGHPDPEIRKVARSPPQNFSALRASVLYTKKEGGAWCGSPGPSPRSATGLQL